MKIVTVSGWKVGFQKIGFAEMLRKDFGYSLSAAKAATDGVLSNHSLELHVSETECERLVPRMRELGASFVVADSRVSATDAPSEFEYSKP
jgi:hypothetical protein